MLLIQNKPRLIHAGMSALLMTACLMAATLSARAQTNTLTSAFDERYSARLPSNLRPLNIFNDGVNTFIEPRKGQKLVVEGAVQDGPYLVVRGLPAEISVSGYPVFRVDASGRPLLTSMTPMASPATVAISAPPQQVAAASAVEPMAQIAKLTAVTAPIAGPERIAQLMGERRKRMEAVALPSESSTSKPRQSTSASETGLLPMIAKIDAQVKQDQSRDTKYPIYTFTVRKLDDLSETLPRWAAEHGVDVVWQLPKPFIVQSASKSEAISAMSALDATLQLHQLKAMAVQGVNALIVTDVIKGNTK